MTDSLDDLARRATDSTLTQAMRDHCEQTSKHCDRLEKLLGSHGVRPRQHADGSMQAIISEATKWAGMVTDENLRDAGLIASLQRMEHYEIAVLGTLINWAERLGHENDAKVLSGILDDDRQADARFSKIAEKIVNPAAA